MEFNKEEIGVILAMTHVSIKAVSCKRHKTKDDIQALNELKKLRKKIEDFLELKEGEI